MGFGKTFRGNRGFCKCGSLDDLSVYDEKGSLVVGFTHDAFGNTTNVKAGDNTLASYTYNAGNGKLNTLTYGNGDAVQYVYDALDRISEIKYNNGDGFVTAYEYGYDSNGNLVTVKDNIAQQTVVNHFTLDGKLTRSVLVENSEIVTSQEAYYDNLDRLSLYTFSMEKLLNVALSSSTVISQSYHYASSSELAQVDTSHHGLDATMTPTYDAFGRSESRSTVIQVNGTEKMTLSNTYQYKTTGKETSALLSEFTASLKLAGATGNRYSSTYRYEYDDIGNITHIYNANNLLLYRYYYDEKGQLVRENNQPLGKTYKWVYDSAGNILTKYVYAYSTASTLDNLTPTSVINYSYAANSDRLTSYNGQAITYDTIGNPLNYRGNTLTWQNGRQLASYGSYSFTYNADGLRIGKTNGNVTTEYVLNGSQVMRQMSGTWVADYLYHENGIPLGFAYYTVGGTPSYYFYETNLQGDVVAIYDANGNRVINITYAFGEQYESRWNFV